MAEAGIRLAVRTVSLATISKACILIASSSRNLPRIVRNSFEIRSGRA